MHSARLLVDPPLPGPANMARDEALLLTCGNPGVPPAVRFYAWSSPTVSLGYFQDYAEYERLAPSVGKLPVVRRTTGGGAILHDFELTYSIVIHAAHPLVRGRPNELYTLAHQAIIQAIGRGVRMLGCDSEACDETSQRGPFFCFARRHGLDVVIEDRYGPGGCSKIAGSAQRRTDRAILQHGSIMLDTRFSQQPVVTWSRLNGGPPVTFDQAAAILRPAFENHLGLRLESSAWSEEVLRAAAEIEARYANPDWTIHRRR